MAKICINSHCKKELPSSSLFCHYCGTQQIENEKLTEEEKMRKEIIGMSETILVLQNALADAVKNNNHTSEKEFEIESLQQLDIPVILTPHSGDIDPS